MTQPKRTTRRSFVTDTLGGVTAAALLGACGSAESSGNPSDAAGGSGGAGGGSSGSGGAGGSAGTTASGGTGGSGGDAGACTVYPQQTEGPFYLSDDLVRSDITEGKPGTPLTLIVLVQSAAGCTPIAGAAVDVWQCDAGGVYSGFPGQLGGLDTTGQTFLRGTQITDAEGRVQFLTIYPGWYPGRTTHIHFKLRPSATTEATSQLYFPETTTAEVYTTAPYSARGQKDTSNAADGVNQGNVPPLLVVTQTATGYEGTLTISVAG